MRRTSETKYHVYHLLFGTSLLITKSWQHAINQEATRVQLSAVNALGRLSARETPGSLLRTSRDDTTLFDFASAQGRIKKAFEALDAAEKTTQHESNEVPALPDRLMFSEAMDDGIQNSDMQKAQHELDEVYGNGSPSLPDRLMFSSALAWFDSFTVKHGIDYALAYGSALGQLRHPEACFIPYDHDMDVFVSPEAADILTKLATGDDHQVLFTDNRFGALVKLANQSTPAKGLPMPIDIDHPGSWHYAAKGKHIHQGLNEFQISSAVAPRIVLYKDYNLPQTGASRKRYNCHGQLVKEQVDRCSFNGPLARMLFGSNGALDLFVFYREDGPPPSRADGCFSAEGKQLCYYVPAQMGSSLGRTEKCKCGQVTTRCMPSEVRDWFLQITYGAEYMIPDKLWRDGRWAPGKETGYHWTP